MSPEKCGSASEEFRNAAATRMGWDVGMDLPTLTEVRLPASRADLDALSETVLPLGGGTWLFSEPQDHLTGLVDLTTLGWTPWEARADGGLSVAATCTIAQLVAIPPRPGGGRSPCSGRAPSPSSSRSRSGTPPRSAGTSRPRSPRVR